MKNNAKMNALAKLRDMVAEMAQEDFKSNKMPKLMALKVSKTGPDMAAHLDNPSMPMKMTKATPMDAMEATESPLEESMESPAEEAGETAMEACPTCKGTGKAPHIHAAEVTIEAAAPMESSGVSKLKKLLGK